jgi:hypothetical protein
MLTKLIKFIKPVKTIKYYDHISKHYRIIVLKAIQYINIYTNIEKNISEETYADIHLEGGAVFCVKADILAKIEAAL